MNSVMSVGLKLTAGNKRYELPTSHHHSCRIVFLCLFVYGIFLYRIGHWRIYRLFVLSFKQ